MELKISGSVVEILDEVTGTGRNGEWRKQDFVIEVPGDYPKKVCVTHWGDNIDKFGIAQGQELTVHIDLQSREYNGRWYTDVKAWKIERSEGEGVTPPPAAPPQVYFSDDHADDDLPF